MATSPAILATMIKLSEPKDLSKPTTGFSPVDSDMQAAVNRYKEMQELGRTDPFLNPGISSPSNPGRPSPEYLTAVGSDLRARPVHFFEDLAQFAGFSPRFDGAAYVHATLADKTLGDIMSHLGRDDVNRRMAGRSQFVNDYRHAAGSNTSVPRVFFDRKNQLRNF